MVGGEDNVLRASSVDQVSDFFRGGTDGFLEHDTLSSFKRFLYVCSDEIICRNLEVQITFAYS